MQFMVIAGEASGDALAAELVRALKREAPGSVAAPRFLGAGGPQMAAEGVELALDLTAHSVVGLWEVVKHYLTFRRIFHQLLELACQRQPEVIVCVDFSGFNRRFARAIKERVRAVGGGGWNPRIIQFVSPQVWASRPGRARAMAQDFDLLLSIFPFEKDWYACNAPALRVEFVGHPIFDRYPRPAAAPVHLQTSPLVLLLPGSRVAELKRHLPPMVGAWGIIKREMPAARAAMVLPSETLAKLAASLGVPPEIEVQAGNLPVALQRATVALASTGTVTVECAYFRVPTIALYKTSWLTYQIARRIVKVKYLAMPNLLANRPVFPEFIQHDATAGNLAGAAIELLKDGARRDALRRELDGIVATLGGPGACARAARAVWQLLPA